MESGCLVFIMDLGKGVQESVIFFIVVGIFVLEDGFSDICYVEVVVCSIGEYFDEQYWVIVNKLIVFIGFGDWVWMIVIEGNEVY